MSAVDMEKCAWVLMWKDYNLDEEDGGPGEERDTLEQAAIRRRVRLQLAFRRLTKVLAEGLAKADYMDARDKVSSMMHE